MHSALLKIISIEESCIADLNIISARKAVVTLSLGNCGSIVPQIDWFENLNSISSGFNPYFRMCWLKAI